MYNNLGTGLGLFICKTLVNKMGGEIECNSEWNSGTTFSFWIPQISLEEPYVSYEYIYIYIYILGRKNIKCYRLS